jgi:hypothetical protein
MSSSANRFAVARPTGIGWTGAWAIGTSKGLPTHQRRDPVHLHAGDQLLTDFGVEWWQLHARPNLRRSTLRRYSSMWDRHVLPHLGRYRLKEITPEVVTN